MKRTLIAAVAAFTVASMSFATTTLAQGETCGPREAVINRLGQSYGEVQQFVALASGDTLVEMYANEETGSWTLTITRPTGITCFVSVGTHYQNVEGELPAEGEDM